MRDLETVEGDSAGALDEDGLAGGEAAGASGEAYGGELLLPGLFEGFDDVGGVAGGGDA